MTDDRETRQAMGLFLGVVLCVAVGIHSVITHATRDGVTTWRPDWLAFLAVCAAVVAGAIVLRVVRGPR